MRTKEFALRILRMYSKPSRTDMVAQLPGIQLLCPGTSVGANYREASRGRIRAGFVSRIGDRLKAAEETEYGRELFVDNGCVPKATMTALFEETRQLIAIFTTIDKNSKPNL
jgi:four helix bundle protein